MLHLLTASKIQPIYNKYKRDWKTIFELEDPGKKQKRFKKLNPYDPETLNERMDFIERHYPDAVAEFKRVLAEPFKAERIVVRMNKYGNPAEIRNPGGFVTPGKTYRKSIRGRSFWNLREYADQIHNYFQIKETFMQKRNKAN